MDLKKRLQTISATLKELSVTKASNNLKTAAVQRHNWTPSEISTILDQYKTWAVNAGPDKVFRLKEFVLSLRAAFPFFDELDDEHFYSRVKRVLYRALVRYNIRWQHSGKKALKDKADFPPDLVKLLNELEENGIGIADDGSVLIAFTLAPFTGEDDGYELPDIISAVSHLNKVALNKQKGFEEIAQQATLVSGLLKRFLSLWNKEKKSVVYTPPQYKTINKSEYKVEPDPTNPNLVNVKKQDGTVYQVDKLNHTCTCPAGEQGIPCKHIRSVLYENY